MRNNNYNLIILHHDEVFNTRELALEYITDYYKPNSLDAEPFVVKYGDASKPNVILAFGTSSTTPGSFYAIDIAKTEEEIQELSERQQDFQTVTESIDNIITATGLTYDDNKIKDKISYEPDVRDVIIGDAESVAQAIDLLSKYIQENVSVSNFTPGETSSAKLMFIDGSSNTKTLVSEIKISKAGEDDDLIFNNNILGVKSDGLYAAAHLSYNEASNQLIFTSSGYKNGRFQDDANVQTIDLGQHTEIEGGQTDTLQTEVTVRNNVSQVTGNVRLGSDNSIVVRDGGLEANVSIDVDAVTNKIIFTVGNRTIEKVLPGVDLFENAEYDDANEAIIITFKTGRTITIPVHSLIHTWETANDQNSPITLTKTVVTGGVDTLSASLKVRSTDNLIGIDNGNLFVSKSEIDTKIDTESARAIQAENELRTAIQQIDSKSLTVENKTDSPVVLEKRTVENSDILSASLTILDNQNNLLKLQNGALFADSDSNSHLALFGAETTTVQSAINTLKERTDGIAQLTQDLADLEEDTDNIKEALASYQTDLQNQKDRITANENNIAQLRDKEQTLEVELATLNERVNGMDSRINEAYDKATLALSKIEEMGDISGLTARVARIEQVLNQLIDFGQYDIEL